MFSNSHPSSHKKYFFLLLKYTLIIGFFIAILYPFLIINFFKMPVSMHWVKSAYDKKTLAATQILHPKIILGGGSSIHFGLSAEMIQKSLNQPCINFGIMALLGLDYIIYKLQTVLKPGDTLILPLEYDLYSFSEDAAYSVQRKYYLLTFDLQYFKEHTPFIQKIKTAFSINPIEFLSTIYEQLRAASNTLSTSGYDVDAINQFGDETSLTQKQPNLKLGPVISTKINNFPTKDSLKILKKLKEWCQERNIRLFLTFPNTAELAAYSLKEYQDVFLHLISELKKNGFEIIGLPSDAMTPEIYMYDTSYHLNSQGISLRTQKFIPLLKEKLLKGT